MDNRYSDPFVQQYPPPPATPAVPPDYKRLKGDDWPLVVSYTDPTGTNPIDISGYQVVGELYFAGQTRPIYEMTLQNGCVRLDPVHGMIYYTVPRGITANAPTDIASTVLPFATKLLVVVYDTLGFKRTIGVKTIEVFDPSSVSGSAFPMDEIGNIVSSIASGPPGPAVSVNGHTGPFQTVTASDVGAYPTASVDAMISALSARSIANAIIFS